MALVVGNVYEGKIVNVTSFGVFVEIGEDIGLVHISEISNGYVRDVKEYLRGKKDIKVKVLSIDANGKISLSIKQVNGLCKNISNGGRNNKVSFEDILSKYLKDSEERMHDFKKSQDCRYKSGKRNFG